MNISMPAKLFEEIDEAAKANYETRSDYIRNSVVMRLKGQRIVEDNNDQDVGEIG